LSLLKKFNNVGKLGLLTFYIEIWWIYIYISSNIVQLITY
jgi:hypothetical protein